MSLLRISGEETVNSRFKRMITVEKYPYDASGNNLNNRVENEGVTVEGDSDRVIVLRAGTFYNKRFAIKGVEYQEDLVYGEDYIFNYLHEEATVRSGIPAYGVILIQNKKITGKLLISYQAVGGKYANIHDAIERALVDIQEQEIPVEWDDILGVPIVFPPSPHTHVMDDLTGVDGIVDALNSIAAAIGDEYPPTIEKLWTAIERRVPNTGQMRRSQTDINWSVSKDNPLWIQVKPYPNAIGIRLNTWEATTGAASIEINGVLSESGDWELLNYLCLYGRIPSIELLMMSYDGSSADILMRSINTTARTSVFVDKVCYYQQVPMANFIDMRPLEEYPAPVPEDFVRPKYPWI